MAMAATAANASVYTISTLSSWDGSTGIGSFGGSSGEATGVYGETFTAPDSTITSFTFEVDDQGSALNGVVGQVYAWSGSLTGGAPPQGATGPALFTSAPFSISASGSYQAVTVDTGTTTLTAGDNYVILFADTSNDATNAVFGDTQFTSPGVAYDGGFNFYNNNYTLASINSNTWDDYDNFGSTAYTATFTSGVPEPAAWAMMLFGFAGLGAAIRARRKTSIAAAA